MAYRSLRYSAALAGAIALCATPAASETLMEALASAYANNPDLNAARAQLRATDEGVPIALSGYRPMISGSVSAGVSHSRNELTGSTTTRPVSVGLTIEQPLFRGFRTQNSVKSAETAVLAGRESLRNSEQQVLLDAVQAFMDVVRDRAIVGLRRQNVEFLREQVRAAEEHLEVGEGTRTDVAQTEARLAAGISEVHAAEANLSSAVATYEQVIGHRPGTLGAARAADAHLPPSLDGAVGRGLTRHPAILASGYNVDVASLNVKIVEGELLPTMSLEGSVSHTQQIAPPAGTPDWSQSASIMGRLSIPIYERGAVYARARQAKETLGQRRIEHDSARAQVRALIVSNWGQLNAARASVAAAESQVAAAQLALSGIMEEQAVGQRTTLDVLDAQQEVLNARVNLVVAQRNRIVAAYAVLAAIGGLDHDTLRLAVERYQPVEHYQAVRDKWFGLRTPDGR